METFSIIMEPHLSAKSIAYSQWMREPIGQYELISLTDRDFWCISSNVTFIGLF
jgi:hypothetical protein